jgi:hypothetical protein
MHWLEAARRGDYTAEEGACKQFPRQETRPQLNHQLQLKQMRVSTVVKAQGDK